MFKFFKQNLIEEEIKEPSEHLYKRYLKGTKNLKNNFNNPELIIINGCRKFKSNEGEGYEEVFLTDKQKIFDGISSQISFLFPINNRISENKIGFRFYEKEPTKIIEEISYFTLLLTTTRKFVILEKNSDVTDNEGKNFIDNKLDCLKIIIKIIKNKLIANNIFESNFPSSLVELLGFCYAIKQNKYKDVEILEPYFPDDFDVSSKKENFIKTDKIIFFEPLLCNQHVSLLVFYFYKNKDSSLSRYNIIFDFSSAHYENIKNYDPIFTIDQITGYYCKFPVKNLQFGGSCSIWFVSTFLCLLEFNFNLDTFNNNQFLIKIIKKIENLMGVDNATIIENKKIDSRNNENISSNIFISYNIVFNSFVNIKELLSQFYEIPINNLAKDLAFYQLKFNELKEKIKNLKLNSAYYKLITENIRVDENEIDELIKKYYEAQEMFINLIKIKLEINKREREEEEDLHEYWEIRNKFEKQDQKLRDYIYEIKNDVSGKLFLFTNEQFLNKLNDTKDIFNKIYDK